MTTQVYAPEIRLDECRPAPAGGADRYYPLADQVGYFMAICALPSRQLQRQIKEVSDQIQANFPDHHYVPDTYFHLTIAGLGGIATAGEVTRLHKAFNSRLEDISSSTAPIEVVTEGVGHFPNCIFAQIFDETDSLDELHASIRRITGLEDQFPFVPHMTMSYYKGAPEALIRHVDTFFRTTPMGSDTFESIYLTVMDASRSIDEQPFEILDRYPLDA